MREFEFVTTSGVPISVRNLIGEDYDTLTNPALSAKGKQFDHLCHNAITKFGSKPNASLEDVKRMLSNDRKMTLLMLRQHSLKFQKEFKFKWEWPLKGKERLVEDFTVNFTWESFPIRPYYWVVKHIEELKAEGKWTETDHWKFPKIFDTYDQMLESYKYVETYLPESGKTVRWELSTGDNEELLGKIPEDQRTINSVLVCRRPKDILEMKADKETKVYPDFDYKKADMLDLEELRRAIHDNEASVETFLNIQSQTDPTRQQRVDLLQTTAFFFPSQAL